MASAELEDLFKTYDTRGTGYLSQDELRNLCAKFGISVQDADAIFHDLDHDDDGRIDYEKFSNGFTVFATQSRRQSVDPDPTSCLDEDKKQMVFQTWQNLMKELGKAGNLISEEKLLAMSTELQNSENPNLVIHFETLISDLLESIRKLQEENAKLENLWKREKKEHERHLHSSEEELDTQVKHLELREKKQAQTGVESERRSLKLKWDAKMDELQTHLSLFEKVDSWLKFVKDPIKADRLSEVLTKLEDAVDENRQVRISLMDTQTSVALMRSDIAQLRSMYEEKCRELRSERERVLDVFNKHDHLSRLLFLLHDDTKRLQDTNDTLGEFVDVERNLCHKQTSHVELGKTDSIIGDYLCAEMPSMELAKSKQSSIEENDDGYSLIEDSEDNRRLLMSWFGLNNDDNSNMDSIMDDIDSGLSTLRDATETDDFSDNVAEENEKQAKILRLTTKKESSTSTQSQSGSRKSSLSERRHLSKPKVRTEIQSMLQSDAKVKSDILENGQPLSYSITHTESEEGFSSRRVMEIKRQLGLDPEVAGYTRQLSSKQSTPTSTVDGTPVPTPRLSLEHHPAQARKLPPHPLPRGRFKQQKAVHVVTKKSDVNKRILNQSVEVANIHEERIVHAQEENHQQQKLKAVESYSIEPKSPIDRTYKVEVANIHEERIVHAQEENHQQQKLKAVESYSIEPKSPIDRTYKVEVANIHEERIVHAQEENHQQQKLKAVESYSIEPKSPLDRTYKVEVANIHEERIVHAQEENHQQQKLKAVESYSIEPKSPLDRTYKVEVANIHEERVVHAQEENHQQQKLKTVESYSIEPKSPLDRTYEVNRGDSFEPNGPQDRTYKVDKNDSLELESPPDKTYKIYKYDSLEPKGPPDRTYRVDKDDSLDLKGPPDRTCKAYKYDRFEPEGPPDRTYRVDKYDSLEPKGPPDRTYRVDKDDSLDLKGPPDKTCKAYKYDRFEPKGPPDRTYKVVFVGDAAVGKSSLIIRLSKGVFVENLTSTLGVDFYMKYLRVDGRNIAVQLWDTAGQERFRSITQSYFRKADGIMLVYDCTNEHSFLNVRQWIDAVDVSCFYTMMALHANSPTRDVASQRIPVVILANKTDQRKMAQAEKRCCVSTEDGQKLAKDFEALFIEVSAKTGHNVLESLVILARAMSATEDVQVKCAGLSLKEAMPKPASSNKCLRKCSK